MTDHKLRAGLMAAVMVGWFGVASAPAQVVERDSKVTGPRGRTTERSVRTERGPGFVDRQVEIKRPGETLIRDTRIQQPGPPGFRLGPPGYRPGPPGYRPGPGYGPGGVVVERDVIVERAPLIAPFVAPFLSFSFGSPPPPPPPPAVVYVPEPVYVPGAVIEGPPVVVVPQPIYAPPVVATPPVVVAAPPLAAAQAEPIPFPVADALGRLSSFHHQSRRDGCLTLGQLGDPRAVPPLIERLQHDFDREVRVAAAWALGELGDPRASLALERASQFDKKQEVRDAATAAVRKLPKPGAVAISPGQSVGAPPVGSPAPIISTPTSRVAPPVSSVPAAGDIDPGPAAIPPSNTPPPFPTPSSGL